MSMSPDEDLDESTTNSDEATTDTDVAAAQQDAPPAPESVQPPVPEGIVTKEEMDLGDLAKPVEVQALSAGDDIAQRARDTEATIREQMDQEKGKK